MTKKLTGLAAVLAAIAAAIVAAHQPHKKPAEPWPGAAVLASWDATCHAVVREEIGREIEPGELADCMTEAHQGAQAEDLREMARHLPRPPAPAPAPPIITLDPLSTAGPVFLQAGVPWRYKGVSAFQLLDRWAKGEDIEPFLRAYHGFNVLRVWLYTPSKDWGDKAWEPPGAPTVRAFLDRVAFDGWYVELTLLTDDDPARLPAARALVAELAQAPRPPNLLLEIGNEPTTHKAIDTRALKVALDASGFLYASGDYEDSARAFGSYLVTHTGRDPEWPRRAHDLLEFYQGGGPNAPTDPAHRMPIVADEPAKLQDVGGDRVADWRAYFGTCALLGAGATFHSETGKFAQLPTPDEAALAAAALEGLNAFPTDAPRGGYTRPVEQSLRTYIVGNYMVRVRPQTPATPFPGWTSLDGAGILWRKP